MAIPSGVFPKNRKPVATIAISIQYQLLPDFLYYESKEYLFGTMLKAALFGKNPQIWAELANVVSSHTDIELCDTTGSYKQARTYLLTHRPDLLFLVIGVNDSRAFDLIQFIDAHTHIIIISDCYEFAGRAFDCNALDYIIYPLTASRLRIALNRAAAMMTKRIPVQHRQGEWNPQQRIIVKTAYQKHFVTINQISAVTSCGGNYTALLLGDRQITYIRKSLKYWQTNLPQLYFFRIHRLTIINILKITKISKVKSGPYKVRLHNHNDAFTISRRRLTSFKRLIQDREGLLAQEKDLTTGLHTQARVPLFIPEKSP